MQGFGVYSNGIKCQRSEVANALGGLPPVKMHCSVLAEQAIKKAIRDYAIHNNKVIPGLTDVEIVEDHDHGEEEEF